MKTVEELRAEIMHIVSSETDRDRLEYLLYTIEHPDADLPMLSEAEEGELALGMADVAAGRMVNAEEVWGDIRRWRQERKAQQRNAG